MTKKHYIKLAKIIREANLAEWSRVELAESLADMCQEEREQFDRERFIAACNANHEQ